MMNLGVGLNIENPTAMMSTSVLGGQNRIASPGAPSNLTAVANFNAAKADLTWTAGARATGYKLYGRVTGVGNYSLFATIGNVTSYTDTSHDYSVLDYDLKLTSINAGGESAASNVVTTTWGGG